MALTPADLPLQTRRSTWWYREPLLPLRFRPPDALCTEPRRTLPIRPRPRPVGSGTSGRAMGSAGGRASTMGVAADDSGAEAAGPRARGPRAASVVGPHELAPRISRVLGEGGVINSYTSMPGQSRALVCPERGVTPGIRPYAQTQALTPGIRPDSMFETGHTSSTLF